MLESKETKKKEHVVSWLEEVDFAWREVYFNQNKLEWLDIKLKYR